MDLVPALVAERALARHSADTAHAIVQAAHAQRRVDALCRAGLSLRRWVEDHDMLPPGAAAFGDYLPAARRAPPAGSDAPCVAQPSCARAQATVSRPLRLTPGARCARYPPARTRAQWRALDERLAAEACPPTRQN